MEQQQDYRNLFHYLQCLLGMLDLEPESPLRQDVTTLGNYFDNPLFRIAVFAPFNYGKSTLINALLGKRTLPIDLIPTTGAAIQVRYAEKLQTQITLKSGNIIKEDGTKILEEYALLDDQRCMRDDVAKVEVGCPHPFLKTGVEFLDLPGTNDREAQDNLVKDQLLTADLIIQVLDARKLMTLGERENLRDWLIDRGINTVIFVVNFLNLLEPEEQKQVQNRLRFVAESFRADLPAGISNLYRVDALPALRARLKGDTNAAQTTGLATFEAALQQIAQAQTKQQSFSLPRVLVLANQVQELAQAKAKNISFELEELSKKQQKKQAVLHRAEQLIRQGWERSIDDFQGWLYLPKLLQNYQTEIALALREENFGNQGVDSFYQEALKHQQNLREWVNKACEFTKQELTEELVIDFLTTPQIHNPETTFSEEQTSSNDHDGVTPIAMATGLGLVLGGPVGAALAGGASYFLKKTISKSEKVASDSNLDEGQLARLYAEAAKEYLTNFHQVNVVNLNQYVAKVEQIINFPPLQESSNRKHKLSQLQLLNSLLDNLNQEIICLENNYYFRETKADEN